MTDIPEEKKPKRSQAKIVNTAVEIAMNKATSEDTVFMNKSLVQANLPHSKPKSDVWIRKNGNFSLVVQAGINPETGESYGLPYGTLPRLGLLFLITKAVVTKNRKIELGNTLTEFMRELGLNPDNGTGAKSDAKRLINQMKKLLNAHFTFNESMTDIKGLKGNKWLNMEVSRDGELWWDIKNPDQNSIFSSYIILGEVFYEAITTNPVPLDFRAAVALKQSPLAVDIYIWLCYEAFKANKSGKSRFIPYASLHEQMGTSYNDVKDFKKRFKGALRKVLTVSPKLCVLDEEGGLSVTPASLPAISSKD